MTLGSINALVASHYFLVPSILDKLSAEAVAQFLANMKAIKKDLSLDLDLAGIIGCMTRLAEP
jgi:cellulose biosynthesis protein BcsQ